MKIIILILSLSLFSSISYGAEIKKDCSEIKNLYKKIVCKTNNATSAITSKKTLVDYLPEDLLKKEKK